MYTLEPLWNRELWQFVAYHWGEKASLISRSAALNDKFGENRGLNCVTERMKHNAFRHFSTYDHIYQYFRNKKNQTFLIKASLPLFWRGSSVYVMCFDGLLQNVARAHFGDDIQKSKRTNNKTCCLCTNVHGHTVLVLTRKYTWEIAMMIIVNMYE